MDAKQAQLFTSSAAFSAFAASVLLVSDQIKTRVPDPYMDEIFHVEQAKTYCAGQWTTWNNLITTPPGLYIVPSLLHQALPKWFLCSTNHLRWVNAALLCAFPLLISRILSHFRTTPYPPRPGVKPRVRFLIPEDEIILEAIIISCFPITYFSGFLFYTDLGSLFAIIASYDQSLAGRHVLAALLGLWSCLFRQTNIAWVAFIAGSALINHLRQINNTGPSTPKCSQVNHAKRTHRPSQPYDLSLTSASLLDLPRAIRSLVFESFTNFSSTLPIVLPYAGVVVCFVIFVLWNGGIVLGDKSNHITALHIPQLYYFAGFSMAFLVPVSFDLFLIRRTLKSLFGSPRSFFLSCCLFVTILWTIHKFTYEHPFLLSDNRHYTFYVWRRIFKFHRLVKYLFTPGYMICVKMIWERIARSFTMNLLITTFYIIALGLTLIPSPLLEPRYFLVPYVLLRLHIRPVVEETKTWSIRVFTEGCLYALVNLVTITVFLFRPFKGRPGEWEGTWQRFMW
ncbi:glucosyltransferase [Puccinia graminis f. sp. tritici]|uniref:Dol-P-Glc:Glc(2)Man(9)GlcNAc(2)-PP-Dol alpha-1,2-glucosyltransferase n=1 Tax=Puccinia graminis f. sp. tritici TaxID=56615 RepID=A0A5B0SES5_PUCGR|nr:glucosyltransferase [Puccinia graminis f. sp. tritici]